MVIWRDRESEPFARRERPALRPPAVRRDRDRRLRPVNRTGDGRADRRDRRDHRRPGASELREHARAAAAQRGPARPGTAHLFQPRLRRLQRADRCPRRGAGAEARGPPRRDHAQLRPVSAGAGGGRGGRRSGPGIRLPRGALSHLVQAGGRCPRTGREGAPEGTERADLGARDLVQDRAAGRQQRARRRRRGPGRAGRPDRRRDLSCSQRCHCSRARGQVRDQPGAADRPPVSGVAQGPRRPCPPLSRAARPGIARQRARHPPAAARAGQAARAAGAAARVREPRRGGHG